MASQDGANVALVAVHVGGVKVAVARREGLIERHAACAAPHVPSAVRRGGHPRASVEPHPTLGERRR